MTFSFSDLQISVPAKRYIGPRLKMNKILNKVIKVEYFKIENSNYTEKGSGKRLCMQLEVDGKPHILFTGSTLLMEMIQKVPENKFPFTTTIIEDNESFLFT